MGGSMSIFLDRHAASAVSGAVQYQMHREALAGIRDASGAVPLGHWLQDGTMYCLLDAPEKLAVCRHHEARGLGCQDVHQVVGLHLERPLSDVDKESVRSEIARIWGASPAPAALA
jgi:hypothetical protein